MPPWVLYTYPQTMAIIEDLRERDCGNRNCPWCSVPQQRHWRTEALVRVRWLSAGAGGTRR